MNFSLKVLHSQRLNETALHQWIIAKENVQILTGHCNCMAGLGESCTHVAAVLFALEAAVRIRNSKNCTDEKAYWQHTEKMQNEKEAMFFDHEFSLGRRGQKLA